MQAFNASEPGLRVRRWRETLTVRILKLVIACVIWCLGSANAWASCGDYVKVEHPQRQEFGTQAVQLVDDNAAVPAIPQAPCRGPECGRQPPLSPPVPPASSVTERCDQFALDDQSTQGASPPVRWRTQPEDIYRRSEFHESIERPPR